MQEINDVQEILDDIRDIFCKYKEKQKGVFFDSFSNIRTCNCGHQARIQNVQEKICWYKKMTEFYQIILALLALLVIFAIYAFWAARRYNRALLFGNGGCAATFLWTYDDCTISF